MLTKYRFFLGFIVALFVVAPTSNVYAIDNSYYRSNDVLFYNPEDNNFCTTSSPLTGGNNLNYAGKQILSAADLTAINDNATFYREAATAADVPWQLLAAVHYEETHLKKYGPSNGYGPFQITPSNYPVGDYTDAQFQDAANKAALFLRNKAGNRDLTKPDNIKYTLFAYNGAAQVYKNQALNLNLTQDQANNGEGSPYVMNMVDLIRDPTASPTITNNTWGQIKIDGGSISYPANTFFGGYLVYTAISGFDLLGNCGNGSLVEGGMTLTQAKDFMKVYRTSSDSINYIGGASQGCSGGPLANCVSFSVYFINKYTTLKGFSSGAPGNGIDVAKNVIRRNPGVGYGTSPQPYAIFSKTGSTSAGHTGVVLGVDATNNKIIIGEAGCGMPLSWVDEHQYSLSSWNDGSITYAYTNGYLKGI
jgi:hypothetical protein